MSTGEPAPSLPRNFLRPCVLLLLRESPAHGYDLLERAKVFGFTRHDPGGLYRMLRILEEEELVRSAWEPSPQGPDRRIYEITRKGAERLHDEARGLGLTAEILERFVSRYSEFVALSPGRERAAQR
ncbi:MAG TPA: helix-turn-helix transcriptional regulator [Solirubrobacteraceae bacterium]|nr:helix-turn-helix transcriptional regulator [Solirubrobacteraceae bacterium]